VVCPLSISLEALVGSTTNLVVQIDVFHSIFGKMHMKTNEKKPMRPHGLACMEILLLVTN